jgi:hypothetical protein
MISNIGKNFYFQICDLIEFKMNEIILKLKETDSIFDADPLHSELIILDWVLYLVCSNEIKLFETL